MQQAKAVMSWRLDMSQTWHRALVWGLSFFLGVVMVWPWWGEALANWKALHEAEALAASQLQDAQNLQRQTQQIWAAHQPIVLVPDAQHLSASLAAQGLVVAEVGMDRAMTDQRATSLQVAQVPVRVGFEGAWTHWQNWLAQLPTQMPGTTLVSLDIKPSQSGQLTAVATLSMPRMGEADSSWQLASVDESQDNITLLDSRSWQSAQQAYAEQYAAMPAHASPPNRVKDPLEFFNRSQLHYVGLMGWGDTPHALVRVNDPRVLTSLYRVPVGGRLGKDAGRVRIIHDDHLLIDEWVQDAAGQWRSQEVRMPLWTGATR